MSKYYFQFRLDDPHGGGAGVGQRGAGAGAGVRGAAAGGRLAHTRGRGEDRRPLIIHVKDCVCIESLFQYKDNLIRS